MALERRTRRSELGVEPVQNGPNDAVGSWRGGSVRAGERRKVKVEAQWLTLWLTSLGWRTHRSTPYFFKRSSTASRR
jgi:hypothetical protein